MKKFYFALVLMVSGSVISAGGLIGAGMVIGGLAAGTGYSSYPRDAQIFFFFLMVGLLIFLLGLLVSLLSIFSNHKNGNFEHKNITEKNE